MRMDALGVVDRLCEFFECEVGDLMLRIDGEPDAAWSSTEGD